MTRASLQTKDGGRMDFGIDRQLSCWFAMVQRPGEDTPYIYEPSIERGALCELIMEHAEDGPEKDAKLLAVAMDVNPATGALLG